MRLIDADTLCEHLDKRRIYEVMDGRNKAYGKGVRDAMKDLANAPTVDAIPIEWMASWVKRHPDDLRCAWFVSVEMEWLKEQEARV